MIREAMAMGLMCLALGGSGWSLEGRQSTDAGITGAVTLQEAQGVLEALPKLRLTGGTQPQNNRKDDKSADKQAHGKCTVHGATVAIPWVDPNMHFGMFADLTIENVGRVFAFGWQGPEVSLNFQGGSLQAITELPRAVFHSGTPLKLGVSLPDHSWLECEIAAQ